ncbi:hypothetical protein B0T19DRAFT_403000 [Cercophora scortea]|uniref:Uncharacterized protein n=1 Tax=Cercophora scortea TaxID=314031 RepID=A0AAE0IGP2_9PEZI|nr:hypothetical protein B0T19DRAFT_403000 [Cercophora scortea]
MSDSQSKRSAREWQDHGHMNAVPRREAIAALEGRFHVLSLVDEVSELFDDEQRPPQRKIKSPSSPSPAPEPLKTQPISFDARFQTMMYSFRRQMERLIMQTDSIRDDTNWLDQKVLDSHLKIGLKLQRAYMREYRSAKTKAEQAQNEHDFVTAQYFLVGAMLKIFGILKVIEQYRADGARQPVLNPGTTIQTAADGGPGAVPYSVDLRGNRIMYEPMMMSGALIADNNATALEIKKLSNSANS